MPLYEFACPECGEKVEMLVSSSSGAKPPICPICKVEMVKVVSAFSTSSKSGNCSPTKGGRFS